MACVKVDTNVKGWAVELIGEDQFYIPGWTLTQKGPCYKYEGRIYLIGTGPVPEYK